MPDQLGLADLKGDIVASLNRAQRQAMEQLIEEYGAGQTFSFTLALIAATNKRERQLIRLFLRELDKIEMEGGRE